MAAGTANDRQRSPGASRAAVHRPGVRLHHALSFPDRRDRAYLGYIDAGVIVLDIEDRSRPQLPAGSTTTLLFQASPAPSSRSRSATCLSSRTRRPGSTATMGTTGPNGSGSSTPAWRRNWFLRPRFRIRRTWRISVAWADGSARTTSTRTSRRRARRGSSTPSPCPGSARECAYNIGDMYRPEEIAVSCPTRRPGSVARGSTTSSSRTGRHPRARSLRGRPVHARVHGAELLS